MTDRSAGFPATWQQLFDVTGSVGRGALAPGAWRGAGGRRLAHSDEAWTGAAAALREVGGGLGPTRTDIADAQASAASAAEGLSAVGALAAVRVSWERRFGAAMVECESLARELVAVAEGQGDREAAVRASFGGAGSGSGAGAAMAVGSASGSGAVPGSGPAVGSGVAGLGGTRGAGGGAS
ncbi:hypothetical protein [Streptomyces sp. DW26H14]|uniref:hypothetical protein n=1 Tax=Streptomyces sp. DW26H14 TaxID=3435395 RepID=UPI00403D70A5